MLHLNPDIVAIVQSEESCRTVFRRLMEAARRGTSADYAQALDDYRTAHKAVADLVEQAARRILEERP